MSITLSALQQQRRDTASNWTSANPTLLGGEWGYETDTGKWKVGDGSTAWTSLAYVAIPDNNGLIPIDQLLLPLGSASAPSLAFTGDVNTGLYSPGADQVAISTNGTGRLFIDANGNVSVVAADGQFNLTKTAARQYQLRVTGPSSSDGLAIRDESGSTELARFCRDGKLGLGASTPTEKLTVGDSSASPAIAIGRTPFSTYGNLLIHGSANAISSHTDSSGDSTVSVGASKIVVGNGDIRFQRSSSTAAGSPRTFSDSVYINSAGNVGIGTAVPSNKLVASNSGAEGVEFAPGYSSNLNRIQHYNRSSSSYIDSVHIANSHQFWKANTTEAARIDSSGRLLVGTSSAVTGAGSQYSRLSVIGNTTGSAGGGRASIGRGVPATSLISGSEIGYLYFTDSTTGEYASIGVFADSTPGAGDYPGRLVFSTTADGASSPTERMRINKDGEIICGGTTGRRIELDGPNSTARLFNASGTETITLAGGSGNATFLGAVSKGSGSFKIDHPIKPETHHLVHSFVEGPQADNLYRGKVDLVKGAATVNIDTVAGMTEGTFVALNREVQCFTTNETGWTAIKGSVTGNVLTITAQDNTCTDTISWLVIGERQDQHMYDTGWTDDNGKVIVEPLKQSDEQEILGES